MCREIIVAERCEISLDSVILSLPSSECDEPPSKKPCSIAPVVDSQSQHTEKQSIGEIHGSEEVCCF